MEVKVKNLFVDVRKVAVGILCMLLVGFAAVSCDKFRWGKDPEIPGGSGEGEKPTTMPFVLVGKGSLYGNGREHIAKQNMVITTSTEWNRLIGSMNSVNNGSGNITEEDIDFSQYQVIAVFDEIRGSGGWSIDITDITEANNIVVTYTNLETGKGATTDNMTQPYHIVKIPVSSKKIVFKYK